MGPVCVILCTLCTVSRQEIGFLVANNYNKKLGKSSNSIEKNRN